MGAPRVKLSNEVTDAIIAQCPLRGYTREIPFEILTAALAVRDERGLTCVPARDSTNGRGSPVYDVYHAAVPIRDCGGMTAPFMASLKVSCEDCHPRSIVLSTGTERHIGGLLQAIYDRTADIPCLCFSLLNGQWYGLTLDASQIIRDNPPVRADGEGEIVVISRKAQKSSAGKVYEYVSLRINVGAAIRKGYTRGWERIAYPSLPTEIAI